eukprot:gene18245-23296_t
MITVPAAGFAHGLMSPEARRGSALPLTITNVMILGPVSAFLACRPFLFAPSIKIEPLIAWIGEQRIGQIDGRSHKSIFVPPETRVKAPTPFYPNPTLPPAAPPRCAPPVLRARPRIRAGSPSAR